MVQQHVYGNAIALGIIGNVFTEFIFYAEFALLCQLQNANCSKLFGNRAYSVFCFIGVGNIPLPVGHAKGVFVNGFPFLHHQYRAIKFFYFKCCLCILIK